MAAMLMQVARHEVREQRLLAEGERKRVVQIALQNFQFLDLAGDHAIQQQVGSLPSSERAFKYFHPHGRIKQTLLELQRVLH